jgi:hypothetical protein
MLVDDTVISYYHILSTIIHAMLSISSHDIMVDDVFWTVSPPFLDINTQNHRRLTTDSLVCDKRRGSSRHGSEQ